MMGNVRQTLGRMGRASLRAVARLVLGLFVLLQLAFLVSDNLGTVVKQSAVLLDNLPERFREPLEEAEAKERIIQYAKRIDKEWRPWEDATAQSQSWSLFAPDITDLIPFVGVELRWDDGRPPVYIQSDNQPADPERFFKVGRFRLRRVESTIDVSPPLHDGVADPTTTEWENCMAEAVQSHGTNMRIYLRWRLAEYQHLRSEPPPTEVRLCVQLYRIPPPPGPRPWHWIDLGRFPVACWRPGSDTITVCPSETPSADAGGQSAP
jgi:hypothetical protein